MMLLVAICITAVLASTLSLAVLAKVPEEEVGVMSNGNTLPDREMERVVSEAILVVVRAWELSVETGGTMKQST